MAVSFQNQEIQFKLSEKIKIKSWIKRIIELEKKNLGQINFVFTSDEELLKNIPKKKAKLKIKGEERSWEFKIKRVI